MTKFEDVDPVRSRIMSSIRSKDTKPEMAVRQTAHALGYRYRLHAGGLPGRPDLAFPSRRKAVFVHGCFWHGHEACGKFRLPATRTQFWAEKIGRNRERDTRAVEGLAGRGWDSLVVWECETKDPDALASRLSDFLGVSGAGASAAANKVDFGGTSGRFATSTGMGRDPSQILSDTEHSQKDSSMPSRKRREAAAAKAAAAAQSALAANPTGSADGGSQAVAADAGAAPATRAPAARREAPSGGTKKGAGPKSARKASRGKGKAPVSAEAEAGNEGGTVHAAADMAAATKSASRPKRKRVRPSRSKAAVEERARAAREAVAEAAPAASDAPASAGAMAGETGNPSLGADASRQAARERRNRNRPSRSKAAVAERAGTAPGTPTAKASSPAGGGVAEQPLAVAELPIPKQFSVRSDLDAGTVTIARGGRATTVPMTAYGSVAGALFMLAPDDGDVPANSVIEISDAFSDRRAKVTAGNLPFLFKAMADLLAEGGDAGAGRTGDTTVEAVGTETPAEAAGTESQAGTAAPKPEAGAGKAEPAKGTRPKARTPKGNEPPMPDWFSSGFEDTVETDGGFELRRTALALDGAAKNTVAGEFGSAEGHPAWGYEIVAKGKHVAWVIAEAPKSMILTGALGMKPSKHSILAGVIARVTATVMPRLDEAA